MSAPVRASFTSESTLEELWHVAETNRTELIADILARGADINARDSDGMTALMRAASRGRLQMVQELINQGAELNASRNDGFTPLLLAAFFGHTQVVKELVNRGADISTTTRFGTSAEMWAKSRSYYEVARYLHTVKHQDIEDEDSAPLSLEEPIVPQVLLETNDEPELEDSVTAVPISTKQADLSETAEVTFDTPDFAPARETYAETPEPKYAVRTPILEPDVEETLTTVEPRVIRTLNEPPDIWDLVHETPAHFKPGSTFIARLTSTRTNRVILMAVVLLAGAATAFGLLSLRNKRLPIFSGVNLNTEATPPKVNSAPAARVPAPAVEQPAQPLTSEAAAATETPGPITTSDTTEPVPTTPTFTPRRIASHAFRGTKPAKESVENSELTPSDPGGTVTSETTSQPKTVAAGSSKPDAKGERQPAASKPEPKLTPQLITPAPSATPKAKVIQWP